MTTLSSQVLQKRRTAALRRCRFNGRADVETTQAERRTHVGRTVIQVFRCRNPNVKNLTDTVQVMNRILRVLGLKLEVVTASFESWFRNWTRGDQAFVFPLRFDFYRKQYFWTKHKTVLDWCSVSRGELTRK